jgi:hypothetical protein
MKSGTEGPATSHLTEQQGHCPRSGILSPSKQCNLLQPLKNVVQILTHVVYHYLFSSVTIPLHVVTSGPSISHHHNS